MSGVALKPPSPVAPFGGGLGLAASGRQVSSGRMRSAKPLQHVDADGAGPADVKARHPIEGIERRAAGRHRQRGEPGARQLGHGGEVEPVLGAAL